MVLNIPKHKNCINCGKCCGVIPITKQERQEIKEFIKKHNIRPVKYNDILTCPFRDNKAKMCLIYPVRPVICRLFGVAKGIMQCPNGNSAAIDGGKYISAGVSKKVYILNKEIHIINREILQERGLSNGEA